MNIKSQKGITLTSLAIYIMIVLIVVGILATITANFQSNLKEINKQGSSNAEIDKFNIYFLKEVKKQGNGIETIQNNEILFTSGNKYTVSSESDAVYLNDTIKIAEKIESCNFSSKTENGKTVIMVTIQAKDEEEKNLEYVLSSEEVIASYENEEDYVHNNNVLKLPDEYQEVEYIESSGKQYINTLIYSKSELSIDLTIQLNNLTKDQKFFGSYGNGGICLGTYQGKWRIGAGMWGTANAGGVTNTETTYEKTNIIIYGNTWIINGVTEHSANSISQNNQAPIIIFGINYNGSVLQKDSIKVYNLKIYDSDVLVREFIPCYRKSDEKPGLYDTVSNEFYINQGTGDDFTKGPDV